MWGNWEAFFFHSYFSVLGMFHNNECFFYFSHWQGANYLNTHNIVGITIKAFFKVKGAIAPVKLNLINHFVDFIPCQFACNSAFRNSVFRWESCKGSVWESVKKSLRVCTQQGFATGSRLASRQRKHTCEACRKVEESRQLEHYRTKLSVWPGS